tara:strand:- start:2539 stop:3285 length:747 start_codon:yes stop_codon:yes gene_type:complete
MTIKINKLIFEKITFSNFQHNEMIKIIQNNGLFVFPSAPGLASIYSKKTYYESLKNADLVFFDSSFFVLLLKFFKNISVIRFSGFKFLKLYFDYLKKNKNSKIFFIDPSKIKSINNSKFIKKLGLKKNNILNFIAPFYDPNNLKDKNLLSQINKFKPNIILINIGGGTQEVLGNYLKNNLKFSCKIICTGAAISFFTKDQAPINDLIDKFYLGWFIRLIFNPISFPKRLIYSLKLIKIVKNSNCEIIK